MKDNTKMVMVRVRFQENPQGGIVGDFMLFAVARIAQKIPSVGFSIVRRKSPSRLLRIWGLG